MIRYLRLYAYFVRFSFSRAMEFRVDFYFRIVMDTVFYLVQLAFFTILFQHTAALGGWSIDQAYIFAATIFMNDALHMTIFSNNVWWLPTFVNRGDVDYYLTRPVSSLFFLSLREFAANSFLNVAIAGGILAWALLRYPAPLDPANLAIYLCMVPVGVFIYYCLSMLFLMPVFWLHSNHGLREIMFHLVKYSEKPDGIYKGWVRRTLTSILPFALLSSFPARALFDGESAWWIAGHMLLAAGCLFALVAMVWRQALRGYASASS